MWDTGYTSDVWSLLDPDGMAVVNDLFINNANLSANNVVDMLTRHGAGKYYSFSRFAAFKAIHSFISVQGITAEPR